MKPKKKKERKLILNVYELTLAAELLRLSHFY